MSTITLTGIDRNLDYVRYLNLITKLDDRTLTRSWRETLSGR
jgi:hypothetical protein